MHNYWNDFDHTLAVFDAFRRRMDRLVSNDVYRTRSAWDLRPEVTFHDDGKYLTLVAEVPGIPPDKIQVSLHNDTLTISGERPSDLPEGSTVHRRERTPIRFARSFTLPVKIDAEKTNAELKDGVLRLTLEKAAEAQPRQIAVKAA